MNLNARYVIARNKLIPQAERNAKQMVKEFGSAFETRKGRDGSPYRFCFRTLFFHQEMNRLAKEAGLT